MDVGLIDVDSRHFPNLALMKISAWHKANGDSVEWAFPLKRYGRVYASKVFTEEYSKDLDWTPLADDFRRGGTGYSLAGALPPEVEGIYPDYGLYGVEEAYGFLSRGCPRGCPFCIVAEKEGRASRKAADLSAFWRGQKKVRLLDPNFLACPDWEGLAGQLADSGADVDFTQGLDIRLLDGRRADALARIRMSSVHFAWDNPGEDLAPLFREYAPLFRRQIRAHAAIVYCLYNWRDGGKPDLGRIYALREMGYDPFVMVYDKPRAAPVYGRLQRWCNNRIVFKKVPRFEDYDPRRG